MRSILRFGLLALALATSAFAGGQAAAHPVKRILKQGAVAPAEGQFAVTISSKGFLDSAAYKDIRNASLHLLKQYSPDKHYFVGLGRDGAALVAFLQNLGEKDLATNFPASSNSSGSTQASVLAAYVKRFIPEHVLSSDKTIVFIDATRTGRGLAYYVPQLQPHLNGRPVVKAAFAIKASGKIDALRNNPGDFHVIHTEAFPEINKLPWSPYESIVSEYPRHVPGFNDINDLNSPRPQYQQFREGLRLHMEADVELDHQLSTLAGVAAE